MPRKTPKVIHENTKIVSEHLKTVAKKTAKTQRVSKRKKKAALNRLKQRLKIVKKLHHIDFNQLNNELYSLRKKRKELESSFLYNQF